MLQGNIAVGLSALNFLYDPIPKAAWAFSPLAIGLTADGAFSPFGPCRADFICCLEQAFAAALTSVGLSTLNFLYDSNFPR